MVSWNNLVRLPETELREHDIAEVNLACAAGLPGAERIDVARCLQTLDRWAEHVRAYTGQASSRFQRWPERYENSWAYFRALAMISVLQRDLGVRYNPAKVDPKVPLTLDDVFIHGVAAGHAGTCASLPVVYVAIGRRLGYPLKLVYARGNLAGHLFARWEEPGARFNIEATGPGLSCPPDDYYRAGLYRPPTELETASGALQSMTPRTELAAFLFERGYLWQDVDRHREAVEAFAWAACLAGGHRPHLEVLAAALAQWATQLRRRLPPHFPSLTIFPPPRRFPLLPPEFEQHLVRLETVDRLLQHPQCDVYWWTPARLAPTKPAPFAPRISVYHCPSGRIEVIPPPRPGPVRKAPPLGQRRAHVRS